MKAGETFSRLYAHFPMSAIDASDVWGTRCRFALSKYADIDMLSACYLPRVVCKSGAEESRVNGPLW